MWIRGGLIFGFILLLVTKWKDWSILGLKTKRTCLDHSIFLGDETTLSFMIENRKVLPLPWIQWEVALPDGICESDMPKRERLLVTSSLLPYQRLKRRVSVKATKRGYYVFRETNFMIGDLLGVVKSEYSDKQFDVLSVYPKVESLTSILPLATFPQGDISVRRWILPDLYQPVGARAYHPGDPMRMMDWKATARHGALMVREFGFTAEPRLSILLNMGENFRHLLRPKERERLITFAASLGVHAIAEKIPVAYETNAFLRAADPCMEIEPVWHADRGRQILEKSARIADQVSTDFQDLLWARLLQLPENTTLLVVAESLSKEARQAINRARFEGKSIQLAILNHKQASDSDIKIPWKEGSGDGI
ncbi:hypothetical protein SANA_00560 [Gottschalkiaceae bacterium SANA]|nr:hypothetical protein SANA_00560 [Gottschalkiaceae bacterium SANA]